MIVPPLNYRVVTVDLGSQCRISFATLDRQPLEPVTGAKLYRRIGNGRRTVWTRYFKNDGFGGPDKVAAHRQPDDRILVVAKAITRENISSMVWLFDPSTTSLKVLQGKLANLDESRAKQGILEERRAGKWLRKPENAYRRKWRVASDGLVLCGPWEPIKN